MGYRSDVAFACDPIVKDIVKTVAEWDKEFKDSIDRDWETLASLH